MERERSGSSNNDEDNGNNNGNNTHNGDQTLVHHVHYVPPPQTSRSPMSGSSPKVVRYRECLKNHAASIGGSVYDGCGEFMPSGDEGSIEALKCAACNCHRNFHRKVSDDGGDGGGGTRKTYPAVFPHRESGRRPAVMSMMLNPAAAAAGFPFHHHHQYGGGPPPPPSGMVTPMSVAYGGGGGGGTHTESSSEDLNMYGQSSGGDAQQTAVPPFSLGRKRFRTKFTTEQKEKMTEFAEKLGWRMNKQDEEELERFCAEIGVKRQVFKVWMHNNKSNSKRQQSL